jgi:hypothetical protein
MTGEEQSQPRPAGETIEASHDLGFLVWRQYLTFTRVGSAVYYEEGNGQCQLKQGEDYFSTQLQSARRGVEPVKVSVVEKNSSP